jgi:hypothetical protein
VLLTFPPHSENDLDGERIEFAGGSWEHAQMKTFLLARFQMRCLCRYSGVEFISSLRSRFRTITVLEDHGLRGSRFERITV